MYLNTTFLSFAVIWPTSAESRLGRLQGDCWCLDGRLMAALKRAQIHGCPIVAARKRANTTLNWPFSEIHTSSACLGQNTYLKAIQIASIPFLVLLICLATERLDWIIKPNNQRAQWEIFQAQAEDPASSSEPSYSASPTAVNQVLLVITGYNQVYLWVVSCYNKFSLVIISYN